MYFTTLNEGVIFWFKNVFNHFKNKEAQDQNLSFVKANNALVRSSKEFNNTNFDKKLVFEKAHEVLDKYVDSVNYDLKEFGLKDGPFPVDCKKLQEKLKIREYFNSNYPELSRMYKKDDDLFGLVFYANFFNKLFKSNLGVTMTIPLVIYRNGEANIIFITFDDIKPYKLYTVTAFNNGLAGINKCNLTDLGSI